MNLEGILVETVAFAAGRCGELIGTPILMFAGLIQARIVNLRGSRSKRNKKDRWQASITNRRVQVLQGASTASRIHFCPPRHNSPVNSSSCCWTTTSTSFPQSVM